ALRLRVRPVPAPGGAARAGSGHALGRRAADAGDRARAHERAAAAAARRALPRARAARGERDPRRAGQAARGGPDRPDGGAEARHRARLRRARLRAGERPARARGHDRAPRAAPGPLGPVLLARYAFGFIRSTQALSPARSSARNLRVVSSVSLPWASNLVCARPMNTSGRGSTWPQSWPRMRRRSY